MFVLKANLGYFKDESTVSAFSLILISSISSHFSCLEMTSLV